MHLVMTKVNAVTLRKWNCTRTYDEPPSFVELREFLDKTCFVLESVETAGQKSKPHFINDIHERMNYAIKK